MSTLLNVGYTKPTPQNYMYKYTCIKKSNTVMSYLTIVQQHSESDL